MNRLLRITRIVLSLLVTVVLTAAYTVPALTLPVVAPWLAGIQLVPALMAFSFVTFTAWIGITLLLGRVYCSSVCPLGTAQDVVAHFTHRYRRGPRRRYTYTPGRNTMRYVFLVVMMVCLMLQNVVAVAILDPSCAWAEICSRIFAPIIGRSSEPNLLLPLPATIMALVILSATLVLSARSGRTLCNTVCPVGTALGLVSRFSIFHIDINTDLCTQCGKCADVCKSRCIDLRDHVVDGSRCVNCFDCINVCPNDAIRYTTHRHQLSEPMMQRIASKIKPEENAPVLETNKPS